MLTVTYQTGINPKNATSCGNFSGSTITVFQYAKTPSGATVTCSSYNYTSIIEHEIGHFYGMADLPAGCSDIMGQLDGSAHFISSSDCQEANFLEITPSENYPVYPTCTQPCAGTCTTDGQCIATMPTSPIVVPLRGNHVDLSGLDDPVSFDIDASGQPSVIGWTERGSFTAFLALDRNGNGMIDDGSELFGSAMSLPDGAAAANGFEALAQYDSPAMGGNGDGQIDASDAIWPALRLWIDSNHDGKTDSRELVSLPSQGITSIGLSYQVERRVDQFGNVLRFRGIATEAAGRLPAIHLVDIYDVFFVRAQ